MTHPSIKFNQSQRKSIHAHHSYRFPFSGLGVPDSGRPKRSGTREDGLDVPVITEVSVVIENELQQSNIEDLLEISHCFKLWLKLFPKVKFWRLNAKVKVLQTLVKSVNRPNTLTLTLMTDFPIEHLKWWRVWWRFAPVVRGRCSCSVQIAIHSAKDEDTDIFVLCHLKNRGLVTRARKISPWEASARWGDKGGSEGFWSSWHFT